MMQTLRKLVPTVSRPVLTYGLSADADYRAVDIKQEGSTSRFTAIRPPGYEDLSIELPIPGIQYVQNALAAIVVATDEGLSKHHIELGIRNFHGVGRRFEISEIRLDNVSIHLVDDYGHHPTEVKNVLATARNVWSQNRIVLVYQPHRYTRTKDLFDDFVNVLGTVDELIMLDTYSANEAPIAGAEASTLLKAIQSSHDIPCHFVNDTPSAIAKLCSTVREKDLVITQGAGNVGEISSMLREMSE